MSAPAPGTEPTPAPAPEPPAEPQTPAAAAPAEPAAPPKRTLEDSLSGLDAETRAFVLGEVSSARNEAKNLRERVKAAEPIVAEWENLQEASKTELERALEAAKAADERAAATVQRVASAELKAALTGVVPDPTAFIEDLNVAKFVKDGEVDTDAITALRTKYAAFAPEANPGMKPNPAQGGSAQVPLGIDAQIDAAERAGNTREAIRLKSQKQLSTKTN